MKKLFPTGIAALLLATGAAPAAENKWEADCRRGYITKTFNPDDIYNRTTINGTIIHIQEDEFPDIEKALHNLKICAKFWACVRQRSFGEDPPPGKKRPKRCPDSMLDRGWRD
jgi:hypothetical protein